MNMTAHIRIPLLAALLLLVAAATLPARHGFAADKPSSGSGIAVPKSVPAFSEAKSTATEEQTAFPSPELKFPETTDRGCDVILLLDSSGSMKTTDPHDYRKAAAKLFLSLLGSEDRVGIYSFGDAATRLIPLTEDTDQNRPALFAAVERTSSREFSTNIADAVLKGFTELQASPRSRKFLILLSDGKLALGNPEKDSAALSVLNGLLPELSRAKIRLHTLAFSDEADRVLLERMAGTTGGLFRFVRTDREVHEMFAAIFEKIKSPDEIPLEGDSFRIDRDVTDATILISKEKGATVTLVAPAGIQLTAGHHDASFAWHASGVFDLITIAKPAAGTWRVKTSASHYGRIFILTDLRLRSPIDEQVVPAGNTALIEGWMEQRGTIVTEEELLATTAMFADVTRPDGIVSRLTMTRTGKPGEGATGRYAASFTPPAAGDCMVRILAQGKTFSRVASLRIRVVEPAPVPVAAAQAGPEPHERTVPPAAEDGISWGAVLFKFAMINLGILGLVAAAVGMRLLVMKMRAMR